jgi:glycosyltransferase involved in cell wall biosynthesis
MPEFKLKILHLVAGDMNTGAARGAYWLHRALIEQGVDSKILTDNKTDLDDETVISVALGMKGKVAWAIRRVLDYAPTLFYRRRKPEIFSTGIAGYPFKAHPAFAEATVIHLHWINHGFVRIRDLCGVEKPIVWTLRDMWPMTGGCHYSMECNRNTIACGYCPQLGSNSSNDLSCLGLSSKIRCIPKSVKIVGISQWISEQARKSAVFKSHDVRTISNNIDLQKFFPVDKKLSRSLLGIDTEKNIILVGARSLNNFYKGFDKFLESLRYLDREKYHICVFGNADHLMIESLGFSKTVLGFLEDTNSLRLAYSAADVFVAPSLMEAFGKTLAESMACGTPVVCFDATGPRDIVDHKLNGYRAKMFEPQNLAAGVDWVCGQQTEELGLAAREKVVAKFDSMVIATQYTDLYNEVLASGLSGDKIS